MSKVRILAIDDDQFFRKLYEGIMLSEGFFIKTVDNGKEGKDLLKKEAFDIVMVDMVMPDWDGIRTIEEIRKISPKQNIIMVTNSTDLETAVEAMKSGASEYILKPINSDQLLDTIRRLINRDQILLEHSKLVEESVENFEILSTYKKCLDILSINDYDKLIDAIVEAMSDETGAQKGLFWHMENSGKGEWKVLGKVSVTDMKNARLPVNYALWKNSVNDGAPFLWPSDGMGSLFVPVLNGENNSVVIQLYCKRGKRRFNERDIKTTAILSQSSETALKNAEKIRALEDSSIIDDNLRIYTFALFSHYIKKQFNIAARYRRPFSIVYLNIHNIKELTSSFGTDAVKEGIGRLVGRIMNVIRGSDIMSMKGEGEFFILLSETDYFGSIMAIKRIEDGIIGSKFISDGETSMLINLLITSVSYLKDGSNIDSLLTTAVQRTEALNESLFHRLDLPEKGLWESIEAIMSLDNESLSRENELSRARGIASVGGYPDFSNDFYADLCELFVDDVLSRPYLRGALFIGVDTVSPGTKLCKKIAAVNNLATRVFVIGKKGKGEWNIPNITPVYMKEKESPLNMIFFLNEETGYVFLGKKGKGKKVQSFHTSDLYLVEKLISRLRDHYLLQWI